MSIRPDGTTTPEHWSPAALRITTAIRSAAWDGATLVNQDGTTNTLSYYLTNDYFSPNAYYAPHAVFYGGYDPNSETFNPANPDAGSLPAFVQNPGFNFGTSLSGIANLRVRPEIDLVNPGPTQGGVNGGTISVLTNWNLGAGVMNPDGSLTLAYRYLGSTAPVVALRAAGNVDIKASITDGFFQTASVPLPQAGTPTYTGALASYTALEGSAYDYSSLTDIQIYDGSTQSITSLDPNVVLAAPQSGGTTQYYANYMQYITRLYYYWGQNSLQYNNGHYIAITPPTTAPPAPVCAAGVGPELCDGLPSVPRGV